MTFKVIKGEGDLLKIFAFEDEEGVVDLFRFHQKEMFKDMEGDYSDPKIFIFPRDTPLEEVIHKIKESNIVAVCGDLATSVVITFAKNLPETHTLVWRSAVRILLIEKK